jgi:hypothetical protein
MSMPKGSRLGRVKAGLHPSCRDRTKCETFTHMVLNITQIVNASKIPKYEIPSPIIVAKGLSEERRSDERDNG